jgi:adenosylmethionine-8-amino-7-oxononanoate aminotransferase
MVTLAYCSAYSGSSHGPAIELAEKLSQLCYPSINRFFFTSGGSESTETSIKVARSYWRLRGRERKTKIISRHWGYHGVTLAAMSATGIQAYWPLFGPRVPGFIHIPSPYPYRYQVAAGESQGIAAANELEKALIREGPDTVAMFIAEPVQGAGGVIPPQDDYFGRIREICDQHDVLFAADEVITGFGRTGKWFALDHWNVQPDLVQFAKGITSGYFPLGGVGVNDTIASILDDSAAPWMHAFTYSAHPVGCAVALRNIRILEEEDLLKHASEKGEYLLSGLRDALGDHPHVGDVRGKGLMCAIEIVKDKASKEEFAASESIGARIDHEAQSRGLFSRCRGDVYYLAPPFVTTYSQLDRIVGVLRDSVKAVLS